MALPENIALGRRIRLRRQALGKTQGDIASQIGVAVSTIQRYEAGTIRRPKLPVVEAIANAIAADPAWLLGRAAAPQEGTRPLPSSLSPLPAMREWPVLGAAACGKPLHRETPDKTVLAPADVKADAVFQCVGDSMINARIFDGDAVFIRLQPEVENGQIAVVRIGEEYTLKRVYVYEDYVEHFEIVGLAVALFSSAL